MRATTGMPAFLRMRLRPWLRPWRRPRAKLYHYPKKALGCPRACREVPLSLGSAAASRDDAATETAVAPAEAPVAAIAATALAPTEPPLAAVAAVAQAAAATGRDALAAPSA